MLLGQVVFAAVDGADGVGGMAGELARLRQGLVARMGARFKILVCFFGENGKTIHVGMCLRAI